MNSLINKKCIICNSEKTSIEYIKQASSDIGFNFIFCNSCGFVNNPDNIHIYETKRFTEGSIPGNKKRVGDGCTPGREYRMAETAIKILNSKTKKDILIFGAGLSKDHELIKENNIGNKIKITDLENFQQADNFIKMCSDNKFDIIIASEVIEHFENPKIDFINLFNKMRKNGIIIASTNIHDGSNISRLVYPFSPGHVSYYSGKSLIKISKKYGIKVDFRLPKISQNKLGGPRKRYVIFYKTEKINNLIIDYFSKNCFALSE